MGASRNPPRRRPTVTRNDLHRWARANLEDESWYQTAPSRLSYALVRKNEKNAHFLIAMRDEGKDVRSAKRVRFVCVQGSRGRIGLIRIAPSVRRSDGADEAWHARLLESLTSLELDATLLDELSSTFRGVRL